MNLPTIVWKELWERPTAMITSVLAIFLGVAASVSNPTRDELSDAEVAQQLETLGANILILPKASTLQDYYSADMNGGTIPEERVSQILMASLPGVEKLSPKLCVPVQVAGKSAILTGILPQSEFQAKRLGKRFRCSARRSTSAAQKQTTMLRPPDTSPESLATKRTIENLEGHSVIVGADTAQQLELAVGSSLVVLGNKFDVVAVLPTTGTVDDGRIFAHLHTVRASRMPAKSSVRSRCSAAAKTLPAISCPSFRRSCRMRKSYRSRKSSRRRSRQPLDVSVVYFRAGRTCGGRRHNRHLRPPRPTCVNDVVKSARSWRSEQRRV